MFKVERPLDAPLCTKKVGYNTREIVNILHEIFYGKCYLCEKDNLHDPEIEHFIPHEKEDDLKYNWENLYYACGRCNNLKSSTHIDLLDCTKENEIREKIKHFVPSSPCLPATVLPVDQLDQKSLNTAKLLNECFNSTNTALRAITRASFLEELSGEYLHWLGLKQKIVSKRSTAEEVHEATNKLRQMLRVDYPFSVFWYWHTVSEEKLLEKVKDVLFPNP
ncbi:HNH endonuclease [Pseudomonas sp. PS02290]|uniref:HNH endonuclease n=1 Tax=Pseudomonas sp. PS02290 TaxID=2991430 RepID=UPI00249CB40E|nr:HNH endonuclease [Pseudomonas sp. PS02290]